MKNILQYCTVFTFVGIFLIMIGVKTTEALVIRSADNSYAQTLTNKEGSTPQLTIDQSGLSSGYTSGVTDFDTYTSGIPTHTSNFGNRWLFNQAGIPGTVDYDLGAEYTIETLAFWNYGGSNNPTGIAINTFNLFTSNDSTFGSSTNVGSFTSSSPGDPGVSPVEIFNLTDSTARYVRMQITSHFGNGTFAGFGELAFETNADADPIPEPSTYILFLTGLVGIGVIQWKRRGKYQA